MNHAYFNRILHLLYRYPQRGKRLIGLGAEAFWELWQQVRELDKQAQQKQALCPDRQRNIGGGKKKAADLVGRLLIALLYLRQNWTMQSLAECVGCSEATVWNYIHEMLPYIKSSLPVSLLEQWKFECPELERVELEQWLALLPEGELLVDSWEQPIQRPIATEQQTQYYSGKKKQHTRKNQVITLPNGVDIVDVELGFEGKRNDSKILEETQPNLPERLPLIGDKAYVGRDNTTTPYKKPRNGELTEAQKEFNHQVSKKRIYVEHVIRVIKIFQIAKQTFRMRERMYEQVIGCICGLVRLRVQCV